MQDLKKVIALIERGDTMLLLGESSLKESLDELFKYRIIDVLDEKVVFTERGKELKAKGLERILREARIPEKMESSKEKSKKKLNIFRFLSLG